MKFWLKLVNFSVNCARKQKGWFSEQCIYLMVNRTGTFTSLIVNIFGCNICCCARLVNSYVTDATKHVDISEIWAEQCKLVDIFIDPNPNPNLGCSSNVISNTLHMSDQMVDVALLTVHHTVHHSVKLHPRSANPALV